MHYEINVSRFGRHFFATAERSLTDEAAAKAAYDILKAKFPESEGYEITVSRKETIGHRVDFAPHILPYKTQTQYGQDAKVCHVVERTGCTAADARAELEAEEWDTMEAIRRIRAYKRIGTLGPMFGDVDKPIND